MIVQEKKKVQITEKNQKTFSPVISSQKLTRYRQTNNNNNNEKKKQNKIDLHPLGNDSSSIVSFLKF